MQAAIVAVLVCQLGSDNFAVRERAHAALIRLDAIAYPQLLAGERCRDGERAIRCKRILDGWYAANAERLVAEHGRLPWLHPYETCGYLNNGKPSAPPEYPRTGSQVEGRERPTVRPCLPCKPECEQAANRVT